MNGRGCGHIPRPGTCGGCIATIAPPAPDLVEQHSGFCQCETCNPRRSVLEEERREAWLAKTDCYLDENGEA